MAIILVVDDDMINRKLLSVLLKKNGHTPIEAENGLKALNIIKEQKIDMVLLDVIMPVMDGMELLALLKSEKSFSSIPVAILTTDDSRKKEAMRLGACNILIKPIKESEIKELLNSNIPSL